MIVGVCVPTVEQSEEEHNLTLYLKYLLLLKFAKQPNETGTLGPLGSYQKAEPQLPLVASLPIKSPSVHGPVVTVEAAILKLTFPAGKSPFQIIEL